MSGWTPRVFWTEAQVAPCDGGFEVRLDGRPVRTPAKALLVLPTRALAEVVAAEWRAQEGQVRPATMPATRMANSALDKVAVHHAAVAAMLAGYGETDLLCYRAEAPVELVQRQAAGWDPLLDWCATTLAAPLRTAPGVMPVDQPPESLARLAARVASFPPFELAALHDLVAISGSVVLGLAIAEGRLTPDEAFALSRIDEAWQAEQWGEDAEAAESEALKRAAMQEAGRFFGLCR